MSAAGIRMVAVRSLRLHAAVQRVPPMSTRQYEALRAGIAADGVLTPLEVTKKGVVLDGRHRLQAARELGHTEIPVRVVAPKDEVGFILQAAIRRRHLTESQVSALAIELEEHQAALAAGRKRQRANLRNQPDVATLPHRGSRSRDLIAKSAGVSARTVQDALTVRAHNRDLFEQIKLGQIPAHRAAQQIRRAQRHASIGRAPAMPSGRFELIYADPPWQLGNPSSEWAPENYYPTLPLEQIKTLDIPVAADAVLFLWAVNALLPEAIEVMRAWGFEYRTNLVWDKQSIGLGVWLRSQHELLLLGRRGSYPPPTTRRRVASILAAPRRRHSEKPQQMYELLERMYPAASKLELFARGKPCPGWTAWGNQLDQEAAA